MSLAAAIVSLGLAFAAPADGEDGGEGPPPATVASPPAPVASSPPTPTPTPTVRPATPVSLGLDTLSIGDAYIAAESRQGDLDGTWRVDEVGGGLLYVLQINDAGQGAAPEGAWRDPRHAGAIDSSGILASIRRDGDVLSIRLAGGLFAPTIALKTTPGGGWAGELIHDGPRRTIVMTRF
jgi:hypothetical protein